MIQTIVYINRGTYEVLNEKEKETKIYDYTEILAADEELFEKFLEERRYSRVELMRMNVWEASSINSAFYDACYNVAKERFEKDYVRRTFKIED